MDGSFKSTWRFSVEFDVFFTATTASNLSMNFFIFITCLGKHI